MKSSSYYVFLWEFMHEANTNTIFSTRSRFMVPSRQNDYANTARACFRAPSTLD